MLNSNSRIQWEKLNINSKCDSQFILDHHVAERTQYFSFNSADNSLTQQQKDFFTFVYLNKIQKYVY